MEHTPRSLCSPLSPYQQQGRRLTYSYSPSYPTPPQTGSASLQPTPNPGLGLYACSMASSSTHSGARCPPSSPQPSELWTQSSLAERALPTPSQPTDIFSEAYDPFSTLHSTTTSACMPTIFTSAPGDAPSLTQSPRLSGHTRQSHRSSISSSCAPSDIYPQPSAGITFTPKIKMEDSDDWLTSSRHAESLLPKTLSPQVLSTIPQEPVDHSSRLYYLVESDDGASERSARHSDSRRHLTERDHNELLSSPDDQRPKSGQDQRSVTTAPRIKKRRQRTTPEDATHECRVCGQLFRRSYNWKSHMDIHNPVRKYPHPCQEPDCQKKFTRKTDLDRHHESVHLKKRNYRCGLCGNRFARKDTLRRHSEDGCPKRFEITPRVAREKVARELPASIHPKSPTRELPYRHRPYGHDISQPHELLSPAPSAFAHDTYSTSSDYPSNTTGYFY